MHKIVYSSDAWRLLHGIVSVYKPAGVSIKTTCDMLKETLANDLNMLERRVNPRFLFERSRINQTDVKRIGHTIPISTHLNNQLRYSFRQNLLESEAKDPLLLESVISQGSDDGKIKSPEDIDSTEALLGELHNNNNSGEVDRPQDEFREADTQLQDDFQEDFSQQLVDYSSHPLVLGPAYEMFDIQLRPGNALTTRSSGVLLLGINKGIALAKRIQKGRRQLLTYEVEGEFGKQTKTGFSDSPALLKTTWKHLKNRRWSLDQICSNVEAAHRKQAWTVSKVDPSTQEGYELAVKGPIRPTELSDTIIYSIRCIQWDLPRFTLRIQCIGDDHRFILQTVAEIGLRLKSGAHVTKLRCCQVGGFSAETCMVPEQFSLQNVINQIGKNEKIYDATVLKMDINFKSESSGSEEGNVVESMRG